MKETSPTGENRVLRGGSYWNTADRCRSANRNRNRPRRRNDNNGFRVVLPPARNPEFISNSESARLCREPVVASGRLLRSRSRLRSVSVRRSIFLA